MEKSTGSCKFQAATEENSLWSLRTFRHCFPIFGSLTENGLTTKSHEENLKQGATTASLCVNSCSYRCVKGGKEMRTRATDSSVAKSLPLKISCQLPCCLAPTFVHSCDPVI